MGGISMGRENHVGARERCIVSAKFRNVCEKRETCVETCVETCLETCLVAQTRLARKVCDGELIAAEADCLVAPDDPSIRER